MRGTDAFLHEQVHVVSLNVSADRIAYVTFRCAVLLAKLNAASRLSAGEKRMLAKARLNS
jgi:hypothetical protein